MYNMCPMYTHVTPILQYIGPCNLNRLGQYSYTIAVSKWICHMADLQQFTQYVKTKSLNNI